MSQTTGVAAALEAAGTGLQITGYNYGWSVKNSNINGVQPGFFDPTAWVTVTLRREDGTVVQSDVYNYGYWLPDWTRFSGTRAYDDPYNVADVSDISLSVTGRDHGFWAGYYGAEFANFSLSVNYSIDPCVADPLWSPSCSGYAQALLAMLAPTADSVPGPEIMATTDPVTEISVTEVAVQPGAPANDPLQQVTVESAGGGGSTVSLGTILSVVRGEQARIAGVERQIVEQAAETGQASIASVETMALDVSKQSQSQSLELDNALRASDRADSDLADITVDILDRTSAALGSGLVPGRIPTQNHDNVSDTVVSGTSSSIDLNITTMGDLAVDIAIPDAVLSPVPEPEIIRSVVLDSSDEEPASRVAATVMIGPTAVDLLSGTATPDPGPDVQSPVMGPTTSAISDQLGAQDFTVFTQAPMGFDRYLTAMPDGGLYASREIYPRQTVVDNPRGRLLFGGTDRLHQEMTQQQYRR